MDITTGTKRPLDDVYDESDLDEGHTAKKARVDEGPMVSRKVIVLDSSESSSESDVESDDECSSSSSIPSESDIESDDDSSESDVESDSDSDDEPKRKSKVEQERPSKPEPSKDADGDVIMLDTPAQGVEIASPHLLANPSMYHSIHLSIRKDFDNQDLSLPIPIKEEKVEVKPTPGEPNAAIKYRVVPLNPGIQWRDTQVEASEFIRDREEQVQRNNKFPCQVVFAPNGGIRGCIVKGGMGVGKTGTLISLYWFFSLLIASEANSKC